MLSKFYTFSAIQNGGSTIDFNQFKEQVVLIVNVASRCGFTLQYKELEALYQTFKEDNFTILAFPCNQFGQQEPGSDAEIKVFCEINFGVSFTLMQKIEVNGDNAHPLYQWLQQEKTGLLGKSIKWNFTKFLINKKGDVVARYAPITSPNKLTADIEKLLKASS